MKRIKTNIVELKNLYQKPCEEWLKRFENGKIDAHEAFKKYGAKYEWLYANSNYDLIEWEIENNCFDWKSFSWIVVEYCPEKMDPDKYNWEMYSSYVARYCPEKLDVEKYNWEKDSWAVVEYCPEKFDSDKYNWKSFSWLVAECCPEKLDVYKYNWEKHSWAVVRFCPEKLNLKLKNHGKN